MQRFGRIGAIASALVLVAATAHADPFTLEPGRAAAAGGGPAWFGNLIKIDEALFAGGGQLYLTNATISFGGQSITVPNATISFSSSSASTGAFSGSGSSFLSPGHGVGGAGFFFGGGGTSFGSSNNSSTTGTSTGSQNSAGTTTAPAFNSQVPGAGPAYNPFNPDLGNAGGSSGFPSSGIVGGNTIRLELVNGRTASITAAAVTLDPAAVPDTPEPSPLLLLATGLGVFFLWKKRDALKSTIA